MLTVSTTAVCTAMALNLLITSSTSSSHQSVSASNNAQHGRPTAECELYSSGTGSSSAFDGIALGVKEWLVSWYMVG